MRTSVTELEDSRVRVEVEVEADAVQDRVDRAAHALAGDLRMPGFRKGKVPPQLVIQRVGREAVLEQALRDSLPEWYERALLDTGITPVGEPELNVPALPGTGEELSFTFEVSARPIPQEQAAAREKLWTPEKERAEGGESGIWTPGEER